MFGNILRNLKKLVRLPSLRARLFLIMMVVGVVPSIFLHYGIVGNYEELAVQHRIDTVQNQMMIIANHLISKNYLNHKPSPQQSTAQSAGLTQVEVELLEKQSTAASKEVINAELDTLASLYDGRVQIINGNFKIIKDTYDISVGKTIISEEVIRCFKGESLSNYDSENGYIELIIPITETVPLTDGEWEGLGAEGSGVYTAGGAESKTLIRGAMLISISNDTITATMEVLNRKALIVETIMIMAIVALAYLLSGVLTKPFSRVTQAINEVQVGYSDEKISVPDYAETVHIVDAFNQLLERMKVLDDSRQEFVANVSHELKTPLTSMKVLADSLTSQRDVPLELYQEFMADIVSEIDRENQIITDLLALVKMDKKVQDLNIVPIDINNLAELVLRRLRPLARKKNVEVVLESIRTVVAEVDEVKMTLAMTNLVENAIKYNKENGCVKVLLDADHQSFLFEVTDTGIGIPEEALTHIYERFYRVEKSHSREIGGTGLGLAITRRAILMHRGSITVTSKEGEGSSFRMRIPLTYLA
ncbi:MAG: two-component sensor histidine kinase [Clostridium sp.]|jgi:signal transduction histidine kinase|nr:two-component sensor histidine kinase [Clostridium sp.]